MYITRDYFKENQFITIRGELDDDDDDTVAPDQPASEIIVSPPSSEQLYRYDVSSDTLCFPGTSVFTPKGPNSFGLYTSIRFDFQQPIANFSLHMRDFGDANPTNVASCTVEVVGYNQLDREVTRVEGTPNFRKNPSWTASMIRRMQWTIPRVTATPVTHRLRHQRGMFHFN